MGTSEKNTLPFNSAIPQADLNIETKTRSNPFSWRGQFSPQLVEELLSHYCPSDSHVLDPFVGSGSVLLEAARMDLAATGYEINPAAAILARTYELTNIRESKREKIISNVESSLESAFSRNEPLFEGNGIESEGAEDSHSRFKRIVDSCTEPEQFILETLILTSRIGEREIGDRKVWKEWNKLKSIISSLPHTEKEIRVQLSDARELTLPQSSVDFVLTSPPYINVFNYHQNYRDSVEELGWDVLRAARSEIGSNRKFRRNRFLTVVQYCMDMAQCFREIREVGDSDTRIIFVVGRESNVLGTPFYNGELLATIAEESGVLETVQKQERVFQNKFGNDIREDIIHFRIGEDSPADLEESARQVGIDALGSATDRAPKDSLEDLRSAATEAENIPPSDIFDSDHQDIDLPSMLDYAT